MSYTTETTIEQVNSYNLQFQWAFITLKEKFNKKKCKCHLIHHFRWKVSYVDANLEGKKTVVRSCKLIYTLFYFPNTFSDNNLNNLVSPQYSPTWMDRFFKFTLSSHILYLAILKRFASYWENNLKEK